MRRASESEASVGFDAEFALRFAMHNDSDRKVKARINVTMPMTALPHVLDPYEDHVVALPTAGDPPLRWLVARRTIAPDDVAVVDLGISLLKGAPEPAELEFVGTVAWKRDYAREVVLVLAAQGNRF